DPAIGRLLDALASFAERLPPDSDDASLIRVARRDFEKALKVPPDHVSPAPLHSAPPPMMPGYERGRRMTSRRCCRSWNERLTSVANMPTILHPAITSLAAWTGHSMKKRNSILGCASPPR